MNAVEIANRENYVRTLTWLLVIAAIVILAGIGLRDPWPADEPRFVEVAKEMVESGNWFFPMRGGELYPDKPPVFMWSIALLYKLTGNLSWTFLIPNAIASLVTLFCVFDLGARLWNVKVARNAAILLLIAPQFIIQSKTAQIDAMVACWITLGMYGLVRHFFVQPNFKWYLFAWICMALGIITKGVGFLPLFLLIPVLTLHFSNRHRFDAQVNKKLFYGPLVMLLTIFLWLLPVLYFSYTSHNPDFAAYRDNILFKQTAERYAHSLGHIKPWYYFIVSVIPALWFPLYFLVFNKPFWRQLKQSPVMISLLAWVALVIIFFSFSPGKRGLYVLPALPMFALLVSVYFSQHGIKAWLTRILSAIAAILAVVLSIAAVLTLFKITAITKQIGENTLPFAGLLALAAVIWVVLVWKKRFQVDFYSYGLALGCTWLLYSFIGYPLLNPTRTPAKMIMQKLTTHIDNNAEVGLTRFKEQFLLFSPIPLTHFSYLTPEGEQDKNAWLWMQEKEDRYILTANSKNIVCFDSTKAIDLGFAHRRHWILLDKDSMLQTCPAPKEIKRYHQPMKQVYR